MSPSSVTANNIKVLMVGALPLDLQSVRGGVEASILNLFSGFIGRDDIEVIHVSFVKKIREKKVVQYAPNIRIYFIPFKIKIRLIDYFVNDAIKKIIALEHPDVIHIQESEPHLLRFLGLSKDRIVVTQHGIMREELKYVKDFRSKLKFLFKTLVERYVFPSFRNFIFISDYNQRLFRGTPQRSVNIYNSVNPIFINHPTVVKPHFNSLLYVGILSNRKNIRVLVDALRALKNKGILYGLHVVGGSRPYDERYEDHIRSLVEHYGLSGQVTFHGWLNQSQLLEVYDHCQCFVLPSLQETLPVSIAEAMMLGKMVVASDVGAVSEMFENTLTGFLFTKNDVQELTHVLEKLYDPLPRKKDFSIRIRQAAEAKFDPRINAQKTIDFYHEIIRANNAGSH